MGRGGNFSKAPLLANPLPLFYTGVTEPYVSGVQIGAGGTRSAPNSQGEPAGERACSCSTVRRLLLWGATGLTCARTMLHDRYLIYDAFFGGRGAVMLNIRLADSEERFLTKKCPCSCTVRP